MHGLYISVVVFDMSSMHHIAVALHKYAYVA